MWIFFAVAHGRHRLTIEVGLLRLTAQPGEIPVDISGIQIDPTK